ncbi:MAG TPA: CPBP family glutamic-type intramembrane protease, partial [Flavisolibacter sp.]
MREIFRSVAVYLQQAEKRVLALSVFFTAVLVFVNYYHGLNHRINDGNEFRQWLGWYMVFLGAFTFPYFLQVVFSGVTFFRHRRFLLLLILAPAVFAWKMSYDFSFRFSSDQLLDAYWNAVVYWPLKFVAVTLMLVVIWKVVEPQEPFYGVNRKHFSARPYLLMLVLMIPLVAAASTQKDFLAVYPRLGNIAYLQDTPGTGWYQFLFELSYGIDFFTIELFFRGFVVLAFARIAGTGAILPMACFYCTIHFGKPLGECISSFFGGMLLGVVVYHTKNIFGGLMVHLGIAWLMELGGYLGNLARA